MTKTPRGRYPQELKQQAVTMTESALPLPPRDSRTNNCILNSHNKSNTLRAAYTL